MEHAAKLAVHKVVPLFTLLDQYGQPHNLAKQRGREHLLLLMVQNNIDPHTYLQQLAQHAQAWPQIPARGIVVVGSDDAAVALGATPFTIVIDQAQRVRARFLPDTAKVGLFVLDRYAELYQQWLVADINELPSAADVDGWMQAIAMQCSI